MEGITLILALAIVTEALVEYGKSIGKAFTGTTSRRQSPRSSPSSSLCFCASPQALTSSLSWASRSRGRGSAPC